MKIQRDFGRAATVDQAANFYYTTSPAILSIVKVNKAQCKKIPQFVQHYKLTLCAVCGILMMSRGEGEEQPAGQ